LQLRIVGPSLSRKKRLRTAIARKKTSDASLSTTVPRPSRRAWNPALIEVDVSSFALCASSASTPTSCTQPEIVSAALER
jgi:hypothetical protein